MATAEQVYKAYGIEPSYIIYECDSGDYSRDGSVYCLYECDEKPKCSECDYRKVDVETRTITAEMRENLLNAIFDNFATVDIYVQQNIYRIYVQFKQTDKMLKERKFPLTIVNQADSFEDLILNFLINMSKANLSDTNLSRTNLRQIYKFHKQVCEVLNAG